MSNKNTISVKFEDKKVDINKETIIEKYNKISNNYNNFSEISIEINHRLADRILDNKKNFDHILDLGAGTGYLEKIITKNNKVKQFISADIAINMLKQANGNKVVLDAEKPLPFANKSFDLIISNLMLPLINDMPKCLQQMGKALKKDGLLLATTLGKESFKEFKQAFSEAGLGKNHVLDMPEIQDIGIVLQTLGFALNVVDRDIITISYPDLKSIYNDLKHTTTGNLNPKRRKGFMGKKAWGKMEDIYTKNFTLEDGSLALTLEVIYIHALRPHSSQQKPLKAGSAKISLNEVLNK